VFGVAELKVMDRHVIANMGVEAGAITTIFPSDEETRRYLAAQGREQDWRPLAAEANASYDVEEEIDLSALEPLITLPSSPGKVVPVREVEGQDVYQSYIGSSANPAIAISRSSQRSSEVSGSRRGSRSISTRHHVKPSNS
jgi:aconitate hydratase